MAMFRSAEKMSAAEAVVYETELEHAVTHAGSRFVSASTEHAYRSWPKK